MLNRLREHDRNLVALPCGAGDVLVAPSLQGRVFCHLNGELTHRLDVDRLENPVRGEFNNLGGNSLWPAPEGGEFAFNYPHGTGEWYVQKGIAEVNPVVTQQDAHAAAIEKNVELVNRRGVSIRIRIQRRITTVEPVSFLQGFDLAGVGYRTEDIFTPEEPLDRQHVLMAPWSLEQFPGADGVISFGKVSNAQTALNLDFYGDPGERITCGTDHFTFRLGGTDRHQIGVKVANAPKCIGALDTNRSLLILRYTNPQQGVYFNIADNDQSAGPFSAADLYSVFNGGALGFFELETIGAMQVNENRVMPSSLVSQTLILRGEMDELKRVLLEREGIPLMEVTR
ncbi:MAG: hypothetical protein HZB26_21920 [Candidatus Hydrogenedentes bacterium]|nr:hypothetical protein [Candidatus Hydrogenedentota bacterium]